ncbi:MAG: TatD family hydrolase [Thaumarchaeota archaeon]|nr:TatD family hydrolase [Nitrososphaerota archaeon]
MRLADVHLHLPEYQDPSSVIDNAKDRGMLLVSCAVNLAQTDLNLRLRAENPGVLRCFSGVHPSDASKEGPVLDRERFLELVRASDGVGEIGLDPKYSELGEGSMQRRWFLMQLEAAEKTGKPVQVHSRGSERQCLDILGTFRLRAVLMHWFEGQEDGTTGEVVSRGYFVSFGPALLYSKRLRTLARVISEDRELTESDGPVSFKALGGAGGPDTVASVAFGLAELWGHGFSDMARRLDENLSAFLGP